MFDPALNQLIIMLTKAGLRNSWKTIKTPAGAFFLVFAIGMLGFGTMPALVMAFTSDDQSSSVFSVFVASGAAPLMFVCTAVLVATNSGDGLLELRPPELQFVLAGPFSDSHVLSYRLVTLFTGWVPLSVFFSILMFPYFTSFVGGACAFTLGGMFIMLIAFQFTLIKPRFSAGVLRTVRLIALLSILALFAEAGIAIVNSNQDWSPAKIGAVIDNGMSSLVLTVPFRPFANLMSRPVGPAWLMDLVMAGGLVIAAMLSCYRTNAGFSELAVEGVARRAKKLDRIKQGNVYGSLSRKSVHKQMLPELGWIGGAGPVAWSQIIGSIRRTGRLVPGVFVLGAVSAALLAFTIRLQPDWFDGFPRAYSVPIALCASCYIGFLFSMTAATGFAGNERVLTWYRTLPINPFSIAAGMVWGTATLLISVQLAVCLPALVVSTQTWAESAAVVFAGMALNIAFASTVNFIAAATSLRPIPQGTPDVFQGAKGILFMFALGIAMVPSMLFAAGAASIAGGLFGFSWVICPFAAGVALLAIAPFLWWISGERFMKRES